MVTTLLGLAQAALVLAVFWIPGAAVVWVVGLRGWLPLTAISPAVTLAIFFVGSLGAARVGFRWSLPVALGCTAAFTAVAYVIRRRWPVAPQQAGTVRSTVLRSHWPLAAATAAAVLAQLVPVWKPILRREQVANLPDVVFHLNALEYVRTEGIADPATLGRLIEPDGSTAFYPSAWHAVAGTVPVLLDNTSLLAAASFVVVAVAWTSGLALLGRTVSVTAAPAVTILAALLSASGLSSALEPALAIGIVPNAVGLALAPAAAALAISNWRDHKPSARPAQLFAVSLAVLGIGACHPSVVVGLAVMLLPWLVWAFVRQWGRSRARGRSLLVLVVLAVAAIAYVVGSGSILATVRSHTSVAPVSIPESLVGVLVGVTWTTVTAPLVPPVLALVGACLRLWRREDVRPLVSWCLLAVVYVLAATEVAWATPLTGFFYVESRRIAPLLGAWGVVLAAEGLARASRWVADRTVLPARWRPAHVVALTSGFMVIVCSIQPPIGLAGAARDVYTQTFVQPVSPTTLVPFFTADELAMVRRLPTELPHDAVLIGNVASGVSYVYGLTGIKAFPFARGVPADLDYAGSHLADIENDPKICAAFRAHGVRYLYTDTFSWKIRGWSPSAAPFQDLAPADFHLIDKGGWARLYEITACDR